MINIWLAVLTVYEKKQSEWIRLHSKKNHLIRILWLKSFISFDAEELPRLSSKGSSEVWSFFICTRWFHDMEAYLFLHSAGYFDLPSTFNLFSPVGSINRDIYLFDGTTFFALFSYTYNMWERKNNAQCLPIRRNFKVEGESTKNDEAMKEHLIKMWIIINESPAL